MSLGSANQTHSLKVKRLDSLMVNRVICDSAFHSLLTMILMPIHGLEKQE